MKLRSLCALTLVTVLGTSLVGSVTASAAADTLGSAGKVKVEEGTIKPTDPTIDPEDKDKVLPDQPLINVNPDAGSLVVSRTTDLDFGSIASSVSDVVQPAIPVPLKDGEGKDVTRGALVQFGDIRSGGLYGYTVTAELTQQFTYGTNVLTGSEISYSNGILVTPSANTNTVPGTFQTGFKLAKDSATGNGAQDIVTADKTLKEGKGQYTIEFGQSDQYDPAQGTGGTKDTAKDAIKLTVPASTASSMAETSGTDTYNAEITWKIVAAK
ncbi:WxL domain-containing protein [Vagococcus sp. BWB3-3]|uniref:WxL domain-containing protein n=1 Tax=Vagococcus allomyrinae TaxID=2794353 RepID=A0A940PC67_9ENTE|nr:WxL domain-containing protein [Vagococcus allomyrinae]MBP1040043.1 WxL domain-containing protein [Vagococcus allomyrinae]